MIRREKFAYSLTLVSLDDHINGASRQHTTASKTSKLMSIKRRKQQSDHTGVNCYETCDGPTRPQWRQQFGNFGGDELTQRGRYPEGRSHPVGSRGEDPIGGLVDKPPKLILILEMDVNLELVLSTVTNPMGSV